MRYSYSTRKIQSNNYSGYTGIEWNKKTRKWIANINYNCKKMYIGSFKDINHAIAVRNNTEHACNTFKHLGVKSFQTLRYENNVYYLLGNRVYSGDLPIYIEVSTHVK